MNRNMGQIFDTLMGRSESRFAPPPPRAEAAGRFQVLDVDHEQGVRDFVQSMGLIFKKGRGFYQFTKASIIQPYKEIVVFDKSTGDVYTNGAARELLGLPLGGGNVRVSPNIYDQSRYDVFVQSTSVNRVLMGGTKFLYEVDGWKS